MKAALQHEELWESFKKGDKDALAEIYNKYVIMLLNYGSKLSADRAFVKDCIQDLFIDLWKSRENISSTTSIKFYLFKALRNRIYRHHDVGHSETELKEAHMVLLNDASYEEQIIQMEVESYRKKHLREHISRLPARQREAINLRFYHNFSNEEIARMMGINYPGACKLIYAGLKRLLECMRNNGELFVLPFLAAIV